MTKIKIVRKIKDKCDENQGCQEIIKQSYDKNQGYQEKLNIVIRKSRSREKIEDRYKN